MSSKFKEKIFQFLEKIPLPKNGDEQVMLRYGTSGIRGKNCFLKNAVAKCALFQAFLTLKLSPKRASAVMITASHNPERDNGVKLSDSFGNLIGQSWEPVLEKFINMEASLSVNYLFDHFGSLENGENVIIFLGRDSRPHSDILSEIAINSFFVLNEFVCYRDFGYTSTPQLFYLVQNFNENMSKNPEISPQIFKKDNYFDSLVEPFKKIFSLSEKLFGGYKVGCKRKIMLDCANGVGSLIIDTLSDRIKDLVELKSFNRFREGIVNKNCGAEFVHMHRERIKRDTKYPKDCYYASFDGDADRVILYVFEDNGICHFVDGDRILVFVSTLLHSLVEIIKNLPWNFELEIKAAQTAYSNGNATKFLRHLNFPIEFSKTGVKHMQKKISGADLGIYFESNGHGTLQFSDRFINRMLEFKKEGILKEKSKEFLAVEYLLQLERLCSANYADAIASFLLFECVLKTVGVPPIDVMELYKDLPWKMDKVPIEKTASDFLMTEDERRIIKPEGIQRQLDEKIAGVKGGRCFVRPSGTEKVIRIYAEAEETKDVDTLLNEARKIVKNWFKTY